MLNEEVAKYRELSGDTNPNVPISRIGGYLDGYEKALEQASCEDADVKLIHTQGLDEGIRCAMCTNLMANDRGCDGACVVNEIMYKKVLDVIRKQIIDKGEL